MKNQNQQAEQQLLTIDQFERQLKIMNLPTKFKNTCLHLLNFNLQNAPLLENFQLAILESLRTQDKIVVNQDTLLNTKDKIINITPSEDGRELIFNLIDSQQKLSIVSP